MRHSMPLTDEHPDVEEIKRNTTSDACLTSEFEHIRFSSNRYREEQRNPLDAKCSPRVILKIPIPSMRTC